MLCWLKQVMKKMFNLTNYKAAPFSALSFWATKTARRRLYKDTRGWSEESFIIANSESTEIDVARSMSILLEFAVVTTTTTLDPISFVQLHKYDRGDVCLEVGEWAAFRQKGEPHWQIGFIVELLILKFGSIQEYYMRCSRIVKLEEQMQVNTDYECVTVPTRSMQSEQACFAVNQTLELFDVHADLQGENLVLTYYA